MLLDEYLKTSDEHIYAIGDCAEYEAYFLKEGTLVGAILYGSGDNAKFVRQNYRKPVTDEDVSALLDFYLIFLQM